MTGLDPFRPEDLVAFRSAAVFGAETEAALIKRAAASLAAGPAWTLRRDGRVLGCGGVVLLWPGVGEAWSLSAAADGAALVMTRAVAAGLAAAEADHGLHRVQASVRRDNGRGRRWLAVLGFEEEGIMRAYGPDGADFVRVARRRP